MTQLVHGRPAPIPGAWWRASFPCELLGREHCLRLVWQRRVRAALAQLAALRDAEPRDAGPTSLLYPNLLPAREFFERLYARTDRSVHPR